ncbi:MAG: sugar ABC transporter permease, partial [Anaerotignum sp.]|nr:sugar ABC transporter permease [Anaerotignum sp.]
MSVCQQQHCNEQCADDPGAAFDFLDLTAEYSDHDVGDQTESDAVGDVEVEPYNWLQDVRLAIVWIVVTMTWSGMGGTILMYYAALQGINPDLYEAATIDGAKIRHKLRYIMLPE